VLGRYVPQLKSLEILLGDEPALEPKTRFYQRLVARDHDEAADLALEQARESSVEQVYDELIVPALIHMKQDRELNDLTDSDERFVLEAVREIADELAEGRSTDEATHRAIRGRVRVLVCPARDGGDELGVELLQRLLDPVKWECLRLGNALSAELVSQVEADRPAAVCIVSLPPGGLAHTRYLCKRLRARFPELRILVGRWGLDDGIEQNRQQLCEAGASLVATSLRDTVHGLNGWFPMLDRQIEGSDERTERHLQLAAF
jgi:hypothetical protein